jgi:hypothetical protein
VPLVREASFVFQAGQEDVEVVVLDPVAHLPGDGGDGDPWVPLDDLL